MTDLSGNPQTGFALITESFTVQHIHADGGETPNRRTRDPGPGECAGSRFCSARRSADQQMARYAQDGSTTVAVRRRSAMPTQLLTLKPGRDDGFERRLHSDINGVKETAGKTYGGHGNEYLTTGPTST